MTASPVLDSDKSISVSVEPPLADYISQREDILDRVRKLLIQHALLNRSPDEIDPDVALFGTGLGLDSLDVVEVVIGVEVEFGIKFPNEEERMSAMRSVGALVDLIMRQQGRLP
ncbi:MAG: acyl carrier protein [Polyangiaceae bacterium]|nr:acyl carrier protein [Polyangiaceae bacterium]